MDLSRRTTATLAVLFIVVVAGCAGAGGPDDGDRAHSGGNGGDGGNGDGMSDDVDTGAPDDTRYDAAEVGDVVVQERARIKTGHVELEVDDFEAARRNLAAAAEGYDGFVSDARERRHRVDNETYTTGVVVLRVPSDDFSALMEDVRAEGTVLEANEEAEDVTDQLVDIQARLDNLKVQRDRLRTLYEEAEDTSDVLEVEARLTEVQSEIERLEAQRQSLERKVALSTIRIELREPEPEPDPSPRDVDRWYDTGVLSAFLDSVNGVIVTVRALTVAAAYVLPYLLAFGAPLAAAVFGLRYRRRTTRPTDETVAPDEDDE